MNGMRESTPQSIACKAIVLRLHIVVLKLNIETKHLHYIYLIFRYNIASTLLFSLYTLE
jgi:hypothetical protein